jgi:hypothetical protein
MSRLLEAAQEERTARHQQKVGEALDYGLSGHLAHAGATLLGFSMRYSEVDCLLTIRVELAGRPQVAFVGAGSMSMCLLKAIDLARRDKLVFKPDKWAEKRS